MTLPRHVDYGGLVSLPAPFDSLNTSLSGFWAKADYDRLDALCGRLFAGVSGGQADYRPIAGYVMLTWGRIGSVVPLTPPYNTWGAVEEDQVAVWLPVVKVRGSADVFVAERVLMFVPFIWLDNAMSLATGREVFGYAKSWGWPEFPPGWPDDPDAGGDPEYRLDALGIDFGKGEKATRRPLLSVVRTHQGREHDRERLDSLADTARHAGERVLERADERLIVPGIELGAELVGDLIHKTMRTVFLKQFRAIEDGSLACLQQIAEAQYAVERFSAEYDPDRYRLTVHDLDSQPLDRELGLRSQDIHLAYRCTMDFRVGGGRVIWSSHEH